MSKVKCIPTKYQLRTTPKEVISMTTFDGAAAADNLRQHARQGDSRTLTDATVGGLLAGGNDPAYVAAFGRKAAADGTLAKLGLSDFSITDASNPETLNKKLESEGIKVEHGETPDHQPLSVVYDSHNHSTTFVDALGHAQQFRAATPDGKGGVEVITNGVTKKYDNCTMEMTPDGVPELDPTDHMPIIKDKDNNEIRVKADGSEETTLKSGPAPGTIVKRDSAGDLTGYTTPPSYQNNVGRDGDIPTINGHRLENAPPNAKVDFDPTTGKPFYEASAGDGKKYKVDVDPKTGLMQTIHGTDGTSIDYRQGNDGQMHWFHDLPDEHRSELLAKDPEILGTGNGPRLVRATWQSDGNPHTL
jgi:hypothetical protein